MSNLFHFLIITKKNPDRFVYQVVVPKALAPKDLLQVYEAGYWVVLPPWDPLVRRHVYQPFLLFAPNFFICYISGGIGMITFFVNTLE